MQDPNIILFKGDLLVDEKFIYFTYQNNIYILDKKTGKEKRILPIAGNFVVDKGNIYVIVPNVIIYAIHNE